MIRNKGDKANDAKTSRYAYLAFGFFMSIVSITALDTPLGDLGALALLALPVLYIVSVEKKAAALGGYFLGIIIFAAAFEIWGLIVLSTDDGSFMPL